MHTLSLFLLICMRQISNAEMRERERERERTNIKTTINMI